jgi:hypothetical protein
MRFTPVCAAGTGANALRLIPKSILNSALRMIGQANTQPAFCIAKRVKKLGSLRTVIEHRYHKAKIVINIGEDRMTIFVEPRGRIWLERRKRVGQRIDLQR